MSVRKFANTIVNGAETRGVTKTRSWSTDHDLRATATKNHLYGRVRQLVEQLAHAGWLVLVSNHISDAAEAIRIYWDKDVVGKGFHRIKHSLGLDRLRVQSQPKCRPYRVRNFP